MRNPTYLSTSRHGIFYFRWLIPASRHPERTRSDVKVSLRTRLPAVALMLARHLAYAGELVTAGAARSMRYDEMRRHVHEHFQTLLHEFQERVAEEGPPDERAQAILRTSLGIAGEPLDDFTDSGTGRREGLCGGVSGAPGHR